MEVMRTEKKVDRSIDRLDVRFGREVIFFLFFWGGEEPTSKTLVPGAEAGTTARRVRPGRKLESTLSSSECRHDVSLRTQQDGVCMVVARIYLPPCARSRFRHSPTRSADMSSPHWTSSTNESVIDMGMEGLIY